ncbi:100_t:CDS:2, partial [Gigaspora rosea]
MSDSYLYVYNIEQPACDIEFSELSSLKFLVEGGFGKVYTAQWKGQHVAAKTVSRRSPQQLKDFNRELNALRKSKNCKEYIIQFFRLSKGYEVGEYILVLQYADGVTLKNYLNNNILELDHKISLCKDIVKELEFLHKENIIHSDLHSKNVLIHQRRELLVDFGLSKSLLESKGKSDVREIQAYVDPKLLDKTFDYTNGKFSDIYSFGVLMWEIYTCRLLFEGRHGLGFTISLCNGLRENRQVGMPWDYSLYGYNNFYLEIIIDDTNKNQDVEPINKMQLYPFMAVLKETISEHEFELLFKKVDELEEIRKSNESNDNIQLNRIMYENYTYFKNLVDILEGINKFMEIISHIKGLKSFIQYIDSGISCELLKTEYFNLLEEYHKSMSSLGFTIQKDDQAMDVHDDVEETKRFIQALQYTFKERCESMFDIISKISEDIQNSGYNGVAFKKYNCYHQTTLKYDSCEGSSYQNNILDHQAFLNYLKSLMNMTEFYGIIQDETYPDSICTKWSEHDHSKQLKQLQTGIEYLAPEILANQKPPYEDEIYRKDLNKIINFICQNKKNFNNSIPTEYVEISIK